MTRWIESNRALARHPKMKRAARQLGISRPTMIGHLHLMWWWAVDFAPDGFIADDDVEELAEEAGWEGWDDLTEARRDSMKFVEVLTSVRLLDRVDGGYRIHDWFDHGGKAVVAEQIAAEGGVYGAHVRWHVRRGIVNPDCEHCTDRGANRGAIGGSHGGHMTPNSTEQDSTDSTDSTDNARTRAREPTKHTRRKPAVPLPPDFKANDTHRRIAREENVNLNRELLKFRDHADANDRRQVDWDKAFCNWLRAASDYGARNRPVAERPRGRHIG